MEKVRVVFHFFNFAFILLNLFQMFLHEQLVLLCLGLGQQQGMPGAQPLGPIVNLRPQMQTSAPKPDGMQSNQQSSSAPVLEDSFLDQRENGHHSKPQDLAAGGQKAFPLLFYSIYCS